MILLTVLVITIMTCTCIGRFGSSQSPVPALDLGGGSTQITFVPELKVGTLLVQHEVICS